MVRTKELETEVMVWFIWQKKNNPLRMSFCIKRELSLDKKEELRGGAGEGAWGTARKSIKGKRHRIEATTKECRDFHT